MPRGVYHRNQETNVTEGEVGSAAPREMPSTGDAHIDPLLIEPVESLPNQAKMDELMFMEEHIEVVIHDSTDPNANPIPEVWNNGRVQRFIRGETQTVKRKFVEVLARAKKISYTQEKYKDGEGNDAIRNVPHIAPEYPFSVISDSEKGRRWLETIKRQG